MSPVEQFIHDLGRHYQWRECAIRMAIGIASAAMCCWLANRSAASAGSQKLVKPTRIRLWSDRPPKKICYSASVEPAHPRGIPPLRSKEAHTPDKHWDRYDIDLSPAWAPHVRDKPDAFLKVAMELLGEA